MVRRTRRNRLFTCQSATRSLLALLTVPVIAAAASAVALAAPPPGPPAPVDKGEIAYGLTNDNVLVRFDTGAPGTFNATVPVTGLAPAETLLSIDFRPANGDLVALGNGGHLYRLDPPTGLASVVGSAGQFSVSAASYGFDIDPVSDQVRVVASDGQSLRLDPETATQVAAGPTPAFGPGDPNSGRGPRLVGAGHVSSFAGAPGTVLYDLDAATDSVVMQGPPESGALKTIGPIGVRLDGPTGFDIHHENGADTAFASINGHGGGAGSGGGGKASSLYTVDLATGAATLVGAIGPDPGRSIRSLAVVPVPTAVPDGYAVPTGSDLSVSAPGVRANDSVAIGESATTKLIAPPGHGTVSLGADGSFTYRPAIGYLGGDSFAYALESERGVGPTNIVMLAVTGSGRDPAPLAGAVTGPERPATAVTAAPTAAPVSPVDQTPGATAPSTTPDPAEGPTPATPGAAAPPTAGTPGGPTSAVVGPTTTSVVTSATGPAGVPAGSPDADSTATAQDDSYLAAEFIPLQVDAPGVLANDQAPGAARSVRLVSDVQRGTLTLDPDGGFTYFPQFGFSSGTDGFTYEITNGASTATARVTFRIKPYIDASDQGPGYDLNGLVARYGGGLGDPSYNGSGGAVFGDSSGGADLPRTGAEVLQLLVLGLGLIALGAVFFVRARRRPVTADAQ